MLDQSWVWVGFNAVVFTLLIVDLLLFQRRPRELKMREALGWTTFWVTLALLFTAFIYWHYGQSLDPEAVAAAGDTDDGHRRIGTLSGRSAAMLYLAGYAIELSLSVDNLFVFLIIFRFFGVKGHLQHRVLFWGILGAVVLRATMILAGVAAIERFHWLIYILGAFLVVTGVKLVFQRDGENIHPEHNPVLRIARRFLPISEQPHEGRFFVRENGKLLATSLFLVLLVVESTDVVFAVDSIPAILGITRDPFIAYSSNLLAILGLRAMFFALAGLMGLFHYLRYGLAAVLVFIGCKMLAPLAGIEKIDTGIALSVVGSLLAISIIASLIWATEHGLGDSEKAETGDPDRPEE